MKRTSLPQPGTCLVWYCRRCRRACKVVPEQAVETGCTCTTPVPQLEPTTVTLTDTSPVRPRLQALSEDEARHRGLARRGQRVTVSFEATVHTAWLSPDGTGQQRITLVVTTDDGRSHTVDTRLTGTRVDAA
ncbi:hypothetical protein, partial [Streptomyces sp. NPDC006971]|uniref:hypothetical protein n=1 Tax=Streptomyces sp. NPDC006971 TaxID=3154784 RepID=UPI0033C13EB0